MSYGAELLEDLAVDAGLWMDEQYQKIERGDWTMRNGDVINVKDMETSHLKNCIAMLSRHKEKEIPFLWICRFGRELKKRLYDDRKEEELW